MNKQTLGKFDQNTSLKKGIVVCLLVAALLVSVVGMASGGAGSQTWRFHVGDYTHTPAADGETPHACDKNMSKAACSGTYSTVGIDSGDPAWWYDEKATVAASFGENAWTSKIYNPGVSGKTVTVDIYLVKDDGTIVKKLATGTGVSTIHTWLNIDCADVGATTQDFAVGDRLAVKISSTDTFTIRYDGTDGCTHVDSPDTDPGFPVPELPTIILMSTGLLALAGFVVYSRSRRRNGKSK